MEIECNMSIFLNILANLQTETLKLKSEINVRVCEIAENVALEDSNYVTNMGFYIFMKEKIISYNILLNYFQIYYLKKALVSLRDVLTTRLLIFTFEKQAAIFLTRILVRALRDKK